MAIDCEMDLDITNIDDQSDSDLHFNVKNPGLVCKISLVNENGEIVLDTLVDYNERPTITSNISKPLRNSTESTRTHSSDG